MFAQQTKVGTKVVAARQAGGATPAGDPGVEHHTRAHLHAGDTGPDALTRAAHIAARHVRQRDLQRRQPLAQQQIDVVQGDGQHAHLDLARPGLGRRHLGDLQHVGRAVTSKQSRSHRRSD